MNSRARFGSSDRQCRDEYPSLRKKRRVRRVVIASALILIFSAFYQLYWPGVGGYGMSLEERRLTVRLHRKLALRGIWKCRIESYCYEKMEGGRLVDDTSVSITVSEPNMDTLEWTRGIPLAELFVNNSQVRDLSPLSEQRRLLNLELANTQVEDLAPLQSLIQLQSLTIMNTKVRSLSPLSELTLTSLDIRGIPADDVSMIRTNDLCIFDFSLDEGKDWKGMEHIRACQNVGIGIYSSRAASWRLYDAFYHRESGVSPDEVARWNRAGTCLRTVE